MRYLPHDLACSIKYTTSRKLMRQRSTSCTTERYLDLRRCGLYERHSSQYLSLPERSKITRIYPRQIATR